MVASEFRAGTRWQFNCHFRKEWVNCSQDEDARLKEAYLKCSAEAPTFSFEMNNIKIKVDFGRMKRMNLASDREVELRLTGGSLPFPPPGPASKKHRSKKAKAAVEPVKAEEKPVETVPTREQLSIAASSEPIAAAAKPTADDQPQEAEVDDIEKFDFKPNMTGKFEFTLNVEDKEDWAMIFIYKMCEAGVQPRDLDNRWLTVRNKNGVTVETRQRLEFQEMFEVARSYPITIIYDPPDTFNPRAVNWDNYSKPMWELNNLLLSYIKWSITGPGSVQSLDEIKYRWHKCVFERYQLYSQESFHYTENVWTEAEFFLKFPEMGPSVTLALKVGPRLRDILRGKEEILNMLFGG